MVQKREGGKLRSTKDGHRRGTRLQNYKRNEAKKKKIKTQQRQRQKGGKKEKGVWIVCRDGGKSNKRRRGRGEERREGGEEERH